MLAQNTCIVPREAVVSEAGSHNTSTCETSKLPVGIGEPGFRLGQVTRGSPMVYSSGER